MSARVIICRCEDVLLSEVEEAIAAGNQDIESLKRYTAFGTGVCQGKGCVAHVARVLSESVSLPPEQIRPFTPRPPVTPLPMRLLAGARGKNAEPEK